MADFSTYAEDRLRLWRRLRHEAGGGSLVDLFRPAAGDLRFRLGTSLADLRIPYRIGADVRAAFQRAVVAAYLLAAHRHKASLPAAEFDKLVVTEGFDPGALRPLTFSTPTAVTREHLRRAFNEAMESHAGLDAGLMASFLGTNQAGRHLAATCHALLARAREEGRRSETGEPTAYLVTLMLRAAAEEAFSITRDGPIAEPLARFIRSIVSVLLSQSIWLALREAGIQRDAGLWSGTTPTPSVDFREARECLLATATLGLLPCLGPRPALSGSGLGAYGVVFDAPPPRADEAASRLAAGDDPEYVARSLASAFPSDRDQQRRTERAGAFATLREKLRELARLIDTVRGAAFSVPGEGSVERLLSGRDAVERLFASDTRRKDLAKAAREAAKTATHAGVKERLELLALAAREYRDDDPAAWMGAGEARLKSARAITALAADLNIERAVALAGQTLLERTGNETEGGETAEYESGRLYFLTAADAPILCSRVSAPLQGHLFCDLKDFTRRTAFLKESVIADFLQREFYSPMLSLASGVDLSARGPSAASGLSLNNLVGDAASFSGDIVGLMKLARDIRTAFRAYGKRLDAEASQEAVAARVRELELRHGARREALERNIRELTGRAPTAEPAIRHAMLARVQHVKSELTRLDAMFQSEKARAIGEKIEAGVFVSYGAAPEVARFEDPVFGSVKVAIAEKINESARGTARNGAVRERVEARRQRASRVAGRNLENPFSVFVDAPSQLRVPPAESIAIAELLARGDKAAAEERMLAVVRQAFQAPPDAGDIFNNGVACSEEALNAYLASRSAESVIMPRELPVASLHEFVRDRFFFPRDPLRLVICLTPQRSMSDLFVFQGQATFRGFEAAGGLGIYEIIDKSNPLFGLISQHHLPAWLSEAGLPALEKTMPPRRPGD